MALQAKVDALEGGLWLSSADGAAAGAAAPAAVSADLAVICPRGPPAAPGELELRSCMASMQSEVIGLIRNQAGHTIEHTESISAGCTQRESFGGARALKESGIAMAATAPRGRTAPARPLATRPRGSLPPLQYSAPTAQPRRCARAAAAAALASSHVCYWCRAGDYHFCYGWSRHRHPWSAVLRRAPYAATDGAMGQTINVNLPFTQPNTPHGKVLLNKTLTQMNLPSGTGWTRLRRPTGSSWSAWSNCTSAIRAVGAACHHIHAGREPTTIKQQMAAPYHDFASKSSTWEKREKEYKDASQALLHERDDLKLKLKRLPSSLTT